MKTLLKQSRTLLLISAIIPLVFAIGYYVQAPWAISTWPAKTGLFTHTFVASILVAIAAPIIWIALSQEWRAIAAGSLNLIVLSTGFAVFTFQLASAEGQNYSMIFPVITLAVVLLNVGLFWWGRRQPLHDIRPMPRLVRISFAIFAVVLVVVGGILVLRQNDRIIPWSILPDTAVLLGWIFLGDAAYFLYAIRYPGWGLTVGPLLSFLTYDIVLLPRLLGHFSDVPADQLASLIIYNAIMIYSALLAIYYLVLNKATRLWRPPTPF
jgi:hypothetical protein